MTLDLTNLMAQQVTGYHNGPQAPEVYAQKPTNIVMASNGIFRVVHTPVALFKTLIQAVDEKTSIPGLEAMTAGPELLIPRIPFKYKQMVLSFYRAVHKKDFTEASVLFFWNHNQIELPKEYANKQPVKGIIEDGQLIIYCPKQRNSSGLSEFHMDTMVAWLRENTTPLCETHSHHNMDAFWSGTDNANENATQFYGVWGRINSQEPKFLFRFVSGEVKENIDPDLLFEWPASRLTTTTTLEIPGQEPVTTTEVVEEMIRGAVEDVAFPMEWMEQHSKAITLPVTNSYGRGATPSNKSGATNGYAKPLNSYPSAYSDESYYGAGGYGTEADAWESRYNTGGANAGSYANKEVSGKKDVGSQRGVVKGKSTMENVDVVEMHSTQDFANFRSAEAEAQEICDELHSFGYSEVIESKIQSMAQEKADAVEEVDNQVQ